MPDVYATITEVEREVQERLADVIELRAADPVLFKISGRIMRQIVRSNLGCHQVWRGD